MAPVHSQMAAGRWKKMSFAEQMANIGSEVGRALNWRKKGNAEYARLAMERALELLDLTLANTKGFCRLRELARTREAIVDDFIGRNEYHSSDEAWTRYFLAFNVAARRNS